MAEDCGKQLEAVAECSRVAGWDEKQARRLAGKCSETREA